MPRASLFHLSLVQHLAKTRFRVVAKGLFARISGETNTVVGAGSSWLSLDNDTGDGSKKSLIVSLPTTPAKMDTPATDNDTEGGTLMTPEDAELIGAVVVGGAFKSHVDDFSAEITFH